MFDVLVVGAGHAGIEAALAPTRAGLKVALVTLDKEFIGHMPCNPSIGGPAKGIVVREIDALGGQMSKTTDKTFIQIKMLNSSKGPGVWSLRAQADKIEYPKMMKNVIEQNESIELIEQSVEKVLIKDGKAYGVLLGDNTEVLAKTVVLTTGTYMKSRILVGSEQTAEGPDGQKTTTGLSTQLAELGFELQRLKTGTPPRILDSSIDFSQTRVEEGMSGNLAFSYLTNEFTAVEDQTPCYLIYTNEHTHKLINDNLSKSSMYGGIEDVVSTGPRYCPSIEDKVFRFADKDRHQLFLEPEAKELNSIYLQGFSSAMPIEIQDEMIRSLPGMKNAEVIKYAYAIEYDAINPMQLNASLESKLVEGLFSAGQINGTSGYEEAAGQGLMAGINAAAKVQGKDALILRRDEAYIGVLIDDLVTKGTKEPYRLLTSRAEHRLLLRNDNADLRLRKYGIEHNIISEEEKSHYENKVKNIKRLHELLEETRFTPKSDINEFIDVKLTGGVSAKSLLKRPDVKIKTIMKYTDEEFDWQVLEEVEIEIKFEGYISKAIIQANRLLKLDEKKIPEWVDYDDIKNIALEAKQKLKKVKPRTIGQASRISGINPADIEMVLFHLKMSGGKNNG